MTSPDVIASVRRVSSLSLWAAASLALLALPAVGETSPSPDPTVELRSPDGNIAVIVNTEGRLTYRVSLNGIPVLATSQLGLRLRDQGYLGADVTRVSASQSDSDTVWTNVLGKHSEVRDAYRELRLTVTERDKAERTLDVTFRAYNDGVGFRYGLAKSAANKDFVVEEELTEFAFTADNLCYAGDHTVVPSDTYDMRGGFAGSQEWEFQKKRLSDVSDETVTGLPLLTHTPAAWVALTEADLVDWSGMWLSRAPQAVGTSAVTLRASLAPRLDGQGLVKGTLPHVSPWRVIMIGDKPGRLVESDLVLNLSTPSQIADPSWIKPGMMAWDHWWSGVGKMDTSTMKQFIDFASEMGWPYDLVDAGWYVGTHGGKPAPSSDITRVSPGVDMQELLRFAAKRHVRLWVWLHWTDVDHNDAYKAAFALYEKWGIAGVKIGFMDRDYQDMVNWYEKITRCAADHHLMVDFHGAYKPTGMIRTWPNQVTREGVMGNEYNKWSSRVTPEHRVTLPFTRFLAGPADYTPGGFVNRTAATFQTHVSPTQVIGTRANQLALFVAYDSPVMCVCDHPDNMRGQPGIDFLRLVPTVWDDTRVVSGAVGEYLVMARRSGVDWYLASMTNSNPRVCSVKLAFLGRGRWLMRWWHDAADSSDNAEHLEVSERVVSGEDTVDLRMAAGGGSVAHFVPAPR